jgi:glycosyltransferase involved in cell wall biosynthesis
MPSSSGEEKVSPAPFFSIIVPVYNGGEAWLICLRAIAQSKHPSWEWIVVDDGSTDGSAIAAARFSATILSTTGRQGPGVARNLGAQLATGEYLCFLDADCEIHPQTFSQMIGVLEQRPEVDAIFGSYDDAPKAPNFVAQYKNLLHHYTHQMGCEMASTFWAGCGVVKRSTFLALGGVGLSSVSGGGFHSFGEAGAGKASQSLVFGELGQNRRLRSRYSLDSLAPELPFWVDQ